MRVIFTSIVHISFCHLYMHDGCGNAYAMRWLECDVISKIISLLWNATLGDGGYRGALEGWTPSSFSYKYFSILISLLHISFISHTFTTPSANSQWNAIRFDDDDSFICTIFFIYLNFTYSFSLLQFTWIFCLGNIKIFSSIWQNCLCFSLMSMKNAEEHLLNNLFISFHS